MPDALRTLAASMAAGDCEIWHVRNDASGYGPNIDSVQGVGAAMNQGSKCHWDPTPWRAYDGYLVHNGGYSAGTITLDVDTGTEPIVPGMVLLFQLIPGQYTVINGIPAGGAGAVTFSPGLLAGVADNTPIRIHKRGERIWHFGHSHTAQTNSWPSWTCLEVYDNIWKSPAAFRHLSLASSTEDPYLTDLINGNFHQDGATAFNPAKQTFWSGLPAGNPTIIRRIDTGEYNPLDIGKFTDFALTGSGCKFTNGSKTVEGSGTSFLTQFPARTLDTFGSTRGGYQIWPNGVNLLNGISQNIVTVASVTDNTHLELVSAYDGATTGFVASTAHDAYDLLSHWGYEAGGSQSVGANAATGVTYWPERDVLLFVDSRNGGAIYEKRYGRGDSAAWSVLKGYPDFDPSGGGTYGNGANTVHLEYNTKRGSVLVVIGVRIPPNLADGDDGAQVWELTLTDPANPLGAVTLTPKDRYPHPIYVNNSTGGIVTHDPVSGDFLFIMGPYDDTTHVLIPATPRRFHALDPDAALGNQYTTLDGSVFPADMSDDTHPYENPCLTACAAHNLGVIVFLGQQRTYGYKHTANTWAADGMTTAEKEAGIPGLVGYFDFGDTFTPQYFWDTTQAAADPAFATAVSGLSFAGANYNLKITTWSAHADAPRTSGDGVCMPVIDTATTYKGEPGSLRFVWKNQTGHSTGEMEANIDGTYGTAAHGIMVNPSTDAISSKLYYRFAMRVDATMLGAIQEHLPTDDLEIDTASTIAPNSATVEIPNPVVTAGWVGRKVYVDWTSATQTIWRWGFYTIESVQSTTRFTLNASPTFSGQQGNLNGSLWIEPAAGSELGTTKVAILYGNRPNGASASESIETTLNRLQRASSPYDDYMEAYGLQGLQGLNTTGFSGPVVADTWHVFDVEVEYLATARDFYTDGANSRVVHSDTVTFVSSLATFSKKIYFSGYGPRSYAVGASPWVPGWYTIESVNTVANTITLTTSPTPTAQGTHGEGFLDSYSAGGGLSHASNRFRLWMDGGLILEANNVGISPGDYAQPYGHGRISVSNAANHRDTTQIHADGYSWYSHFLFSTQPIPFETATAGAVPPAVNLLMPWSIQS